MIPSSLRRFTRRANRVLGALLAVVVVLGASPSAPAQAEARPRALPQLTREAAAAPERTFRVLIGRVGRGRAADAYVTGRGHRKVKDVGPPIRDFAVKSLALVTASVVLFGLIVQGAGLAVATAALVLASAPASRSFRLVSTLLLAGALALFCTLVFVTGVGLPFPALGPWLRG